ncbi:MAG: hypothetical protein H6595_12295 [Flavobacteriales bacterium]|nr:hypothetical protein [Flavobacteriales bacterium]MCB9168243.1 hypothetical protein [Flavobacteriales bacterium]
MLRRAIADFRTVQGRDHLFTYLAEGSVLVGIVLVYKLAAWRLPGQGFEEYTVVRRTISFLQMLSLCGMAVGIVRFVAMAPGPRERVRLLRSAMRLLAFVSAGLLVVFASFRPELSGLFFGSPDQTALVMPIAALTVAMVLHTAIYGYWRGAHHMTRANVLQIMNMAVAPNLAMWTFDDLGTVLWATAAAWAGFASIGLVPVLASPAAAPDTQRIQRMVRYGLLRLPGDAAFAGLLTIPVYLVNHVSGLALGAQVAFGATLINVAGAAYSPISLLLLPSAASLLAKGQWEALDNRIGRVMQGVVLSALLMVLVFELLATPLLRIYLGPTGVNMEMVCRVMFLGAFLYAVHVALRSVLDAYYAAPRNTINLLYSVVVALTMGVLYLFVVPKLIMAMILVLAPLATLAFLTWRDVRWVRADLRASGDPGERPMRVVFLGWKDRPFLSLTQDLGIDPVTPGPRDPMRRKGAYLRRMEQAHRPDLVLVRDRDWMIPVLLNARRPVVFDLRGQATSGRLALVHQFALLGAAGIIIGSEKDRPGIRWRRRHAVVVPLDDQGAALAAFLRGLSWKERA